MKPSVPIHHRADRRFPWVLAACGACALLWWAALATRVIRPDFAGVAVRVTGVFVPGGQFANAAFAHSKGVRVWGSWAGDDRHTGELSLGPFLAPPVLRFGVDGYPSDRGNRVYLQLVATGEKLPVNCGAAGGEQWTIVSVAPPPDWVGKPVTLHACDGSTGLGGWLAISEPIAGGHGTGVEFIESLAAWTLNGLLYSLLWCAALRHLAARPWVAPPWKPLLAAAVVALLGYLAFWAYFAHPLLGKIFSWTILILGGVGAMTGRRPAPTLDSEIISPAKLLLLIGLLYVGLLHLFPSSLDFDSLAANRFREALPGDNTLPRNVAVALLRGETLRHADAEWQSSDRPPLQSGCLLLTLPLTSALHLDERTANGTAALWLQSLWVFAAYGLFRSLGLPRTRACAWLPVLAISGFFAQNTVFTWPKLSAAAFACGAFALWVLPCKHEEKLTGSPPASRPLVVVPLGALLAALAWLSHGGVAFSFLALLPWIFWRMLRDQLIPWALAIVVFALLAAPWLAYQKLYDPPGDRLLKMHLAGVTGKDSRGVWRTIRDAYGVLSFDQIAAHKAANLHRQIEGGWSGLVEVSFAGSPQRRNDEFFLPARALTWWWLGAVALPFVVFGGRLKTTWRQHAALVVWTLLTILLWCLLMFSGGQTVIHQGSYAVMLVLFVVLSTWCERAGRWMIAVVAGLQILTFVTTWIGPNSVVHGPVNPFAVGAIVLALATLALFARRGVRIRSQPAVVDSPASMRQVAPCKP